MNKNYRRKPTSRELNRVVNTFTVYKFIKSLTTDFTKMDAYKLGVIDANGNYRRNPEGAISVFDRLIINLKVLLNKIPDPSIKAKLNYLTTGISLLAEEYGENPEDVKREIEEYLEETMLLNEATANVKDGKPKIETTGHMTHIADWSYTPHGTDEHGNPKVDPLLGVKHAEALHDWHEGVHNSDVDVSIKADGGMSGLLGHHPETGEIVGAYKSGKSFYTRKQLETMENAPAWRDDMVRLLKHAEGMKIKKGHFFQGDVLWTHRGTEKGGLTPQGTANPNTIHYKPTHHQSAMAIHGHFIMDKKGNLTRQKGVDYSQLEHPDMHVPKLGLAPGSARLKSSEKATFQNAITKAKKAMTPEVHAYAANLHKDKKFAKFMQEYSNEVVATTGKRTISSMMSYLTKPISTAKTSKGYMSKPTQAKMSEKGRTALQTYIQSHILNNKKALTGLLRHQQHLSSIKQPSANALRRTQEGHTLVPSEGHEHEGVVLNVNGVMSKITREGAGGFSQRNRENSLTRFGSDELQEEVSTMSAGAMTASSGAVTGVTPGKPEETIVRKKPNIRRRKRIAHLKEIWNILKESAQDRGKMPKPVKVSGSTKATIFGVSKHAATPRDILQIAKKHGFESRQGSKHIHIFHGDTLIGSLSKGTDARQADIPKLLRHMQSIVLARREAQVDRVSPSIVQKAGAVSPGNKQGRLTRVSRAIDRLKSQRGDISPTAAQARQRVIDMLKAREKR